MKTIKDNAITLESDSPNHNHSSAVTTTKDSDRENGLANEIISTNDPGDLIVVGHGNSIRNILTKFFPNYANQDRKNDALRFAESQSLMVLKWME